MDIDSKIGSIFNEEIAKNGIKKSYIARKIGITQSQLSYYLHGKHKFTLKMFILFLKALEMDPNDVIFKM